MDVLNELNVLIEKYKKNQSYYKTSSNHYNEHSCRTEYIDLLLSCLGWDVSNSKGVAPQFREVIAENYSSNSDRPDYSLTLRGVTKFFVEAKKPSVDIFNLAAPAIQARKYGWNSKHKISILTNFEYLIIYDTTVVPSLDDDSSVARFRVYNYLEYCDKFEEIKSLISRDAVYSGEFDVFFESNVSGADAHKQEVDELFLSQINKWRIILSNELYKTKKYEDISVINDVVQEFINQIVFLRICEDKKLPLYSNLNDSIEDISKVEERLEKLIQKADKRYNSKLFSETSTIRELGSNVVKDIIQGLYYPQSPYLFNIIEPNLIGKIYEMFLTEKLVLASDGTIKLAQKEEASNRSVVTTPTEIVKYMVEKTLSALCLGKSPSEILGLKIADIACGSGVYLEEVFSYLQNHCVSWYLENDPKHLIEIGNGRFKLPLEEKKAILCSCIYGVDIDVHAVEVAKFSLLVKLIEGENEPSVVESTPILPDLCDNIQHGNALVSLAELDEGVIGYQQLLDIAPFDWDRINSDKKFDAIVGNPPYVSTEDLHSLVSKVEFAAYKAHYRTSYKQFDKYFLFIERAISLTKENGVICYIIPNKFIRNVSGKKLRQLISEGNILVSLDDFGDIQLFSDKTVYSTIILLNLSEQKEFEYSKVDSVLALWGGEIPDKIKLDSHSLGKSPWRLTTDFEFLKLLIQLDNRAVPISKYTEIFNGIQTSAERPTPVYWFSNEEIRYEKLDSIIFERNERSYSIEKSILKPYFKPTKKSERGLNSYSSLSVDKWIIFPYNNDGELIQVDQMESKYPGAFSYLEENYDRLVPKTISKIGKRDVPGATEKTWYQYGRTQALRAFVGDPKLIVGILSKDPMYMYDDQNMLISSGGTAGYCAITTKEGSPYEIEYIQAWLTNRYTEKIIKISGSDFEGGFISRGTSVLQSLPFIELDFSKKEQRELHDCVVNKTREIYKINKDLRRQIPKNKFNILQCRKEKLISEVENLISKVYQLKF